MGFEDGPHRTTNRFEGMAPAAAIRMAREAGQEVRLTFSLTGPRRIYIYRKGAPSETGERRDIARENIEQGYELGEITLEPQEQQLLEHLEWFAEEIRVRADNLQTSLFQSTRETYGKDKGGYFRTYRDLGPAGKIFHYLRDKRRTDLLWRIRDVESIARGLVGTVRTIAYQGVVDGRPLDKEAFDGAIRHIDSVRENLVDQLDQIQKEIA